MRRAASFGVLVGWLVAPVGLAAPLDSVEEVRACMRANLPERTSRQRIELKARDRAGGERVLEAQLHWKRFRRDLPRVRIRVDSPPDMRGATYLLIEQEKGRDSEMYMYLPAVQRVRRISERSMSDQLWGTDFSYDDMRQLQWIAAEGSHEQRENSEVAGRPVYVLDLALAPEEGSTYERLQAYVDQETCVSLRIEFFERGDKPRKVLEADPSSLAQEGERWLARKMEMKDLREHTTSWLRIVEVQHDGDIPDRIFNPTLLDRGR